MLRAVPVTDGSKVMAVRVREVDGGYRIESQRYLGLDVLNRSRSAATTLTDQPYTTTPALAA